MIQPQRLHGQPANIARYYTVGDYYTKGGNEPSEWGGKLAVDLGLALEAPDIAAVAFLVALDADLVARHHRALEAHPIHRGEVHVGIGDAGRRKVVRREPAGQELATRPTRSGEIDGE